MNENIRSSFNSKQIYVSGACEQVTISISFILTGLEIEARVTLSAERSREKGITFDKKLKVRIILLSTVD